MKLYRCPRCGSERLAAMSKGKPKCRCESGVKMQEVGVRSRNVSRLKVTNTGPQGGSAGAKERCVECNRLLGLRNRRDRAKPNTFRLCFACRASPPESYYCNGTTTTGTTCRRIRDKDSDFCSWHR